MEIRLDAPDGSLAGAIDVPNTKFKYETFSTSLTKCKGVHDLYFVFKSNSIQKKNLFNFDWWEVKI